MPDLKIGAWVVPEGAIAFTAVRSPGPGGQNVNKVASKVELRLAVDRIAGISPEGRERLKALAGKRWVEPDALLITASETRSQAENRVLAEEKLVRLLEAAQIVPKRRKQTKPTRASKERRLQEKKARGQVKRGRGQREEPI